MKSFGLKGLSLAFVGFTLALTLAAGCEVTTGDSTSPRTYACTPGERIEASCGCAGIGSQCSGDPTLAMCDSSVSSCERTSAFEYDDDTCGLCPYVVGTCPSNGRVTVRANGAGGRSFSCLWDVVGANGRTLSRSTGI